MPDLGADAPEAGPEAGWAKPERPMDRPPVNAGEIGLRKKSFGPVRRLWTRKGLRPRRGVAPQVPMRRMKASPFKTPRPMDERRRLGLLREPLQAPPFR